MTSNDGSPLTPTAVATTDNTMAETAETGAPALADNDVSPLLDLSEEVLVHIVKIGRFTLTDVGHLRVTCTALRGFLDRIRDTVNECVVGDLSKYRPYGHWDIDRAAKSGHFELIQLLHEDEVKHGRVSRCTLAALDGVLGHGNWDAFAFLVRNRKEVDPRSNSSLYDKARSRWKWTWENLTREQTVFLLEEAQGYLVGLAPVHAAVGPIRRGELDVVARLLPLVDGHSIMPLLELSFRHCCQSREVFDAVFRECRSRAIDNSRLTACLFYAAASSDTAGLELLELAFKYAPTALADLQQWARDRIANAAVDTEVIERLRALGLRRTRVNGKAHDAVYSMLKEGAKCDFEALVQLLLHNDYASAEVALKRTSRDDIVRTMGHLAERCAVDALRWMHARGYQLTGIDLLLSSTIKLRQYPLTAEYVEFMWPLSSTLPYSVNVVNTDPYALSTAHTWFKDAVRQGDVALLRRLCECVDVAAAFAQTNAPRTLADLAVAAGHTDIVSYMIDVNARIVPVKDSAAARRHGAFDLCTRPFELTRTLDVAVRAGNLRLARLIDGYIPGLRASLASACLSRRWRVFHWVFDRLGAAERAQQLSDARTAAFKVQRMEFVWWIDRHMTVGMVQAH